MMQNIFIAPAIMTGVGLFFGIVLAIAYKFLRVQDDPRIEKVEELLPGSNCGACGQPGCHSFAEEVVEGTQQPSACTVSSPDAIEVIADFLDVDPGKQEKRVARLHCAGGKGQAHQIAEYRGFENCHAAALVSGGGKGCSWGCLGLADCENACTFQAIQMIPNALPVVDIDKCTACGDCVAACPRNLFEIVPLNHQLFVQCSIPLEGEAARVLCSTACDACGKCAADAAPNLIRMENNLPVVDYTAGGPAKPEATFRCPTGAIQWLECTQFSEKDNAQRDSEDPYTRFVSPQ
ncbi:MAG: RnfABCDGE type electron transport complex subunit B [Candidatus Parabeggiatoa sp.]|nr:RnfABCDGE type electron transport complex subunit B [Candidatus Parabeggiatoa sp.]